MDHEAVYAPRSSNDRLLLGLKGSLNEYELDLLRLRGLEARREKAGRGELVAGVPIGYRVADDGRLEKTPDLRVRQMIELIFVKFFELGSARQVMLWLLASGMQVAITRDRRGTVQWKGPTADYVNRMLTNPAYAGAYAYGRTTQRMRVVDGQLQTSSGRVRRSEWPVLLHDRHEAYISWQQFERAEQMLTKNAQARGGHGTARHGTVVRYSPDWCSAAAAAAAWVSATVALPCTGAIDVTLPTCAMALRSVSRALEANLESLENLRTNLAEQGYDLDKIPLVHQL